MIRLTTFISALFLTLSLNAQIGYQVSLLDAATGQPRADETVSVKVEITDSSGSLICSETKSATSDDFGVLSLTIGNTSTFENADWSKLPFYISATVDDVLLGRSQILNVPVAEYAKKVADLDKSILKSKVWTGSYSEGEGSYSFRFTDETATLVHSNPYDGGYSATYKYVIFGNLIVCYGSGTKDSKHLFYTGSCLAEADGTDYK